MSASTPGQASGGRGERTVISPSILPGAIIASTDNSHSTVTEPAARKNNAAYTKQRKFLSLCKTFLHGSGRGFLGVIYVKTIANFCLGILPQIPGLVRGNKKAWKSFLPRLFRDCIPLGLSVGTVMGLFKSAQSLLETLSLGNFSRYSGALAVVLSSPGFFLMPTEWNEWLSTTAFLRALEVAVKRAVENGYLPVVENMDFYVMCVASVSVVSAYTYYPLAMGTGYLSFFNTFFQQDAASAEQFRNLIKGQNIDAEAMDIIRAAGSAGFKGAPPYPRTLVTPRNYDLRYRWAWKQVMHPATSYLVFVPQYFIKGWLQACLFYLPIFVMPRMMFNPLSVLSKPIETLQKLLPDIGNSALFLTTYCTGGFNSVGLWRYLGFTNSHFSYGGFVTVVLASITAALGILIERPSRRLEMSEFVFQKGATSIWEAFYKKRYSETTLRRMWYFLMTGSLSYMVHAYYNYPHTMRGMYRAMFSGFTGHRTKGKGDDSKTRKEEKK
jgi:hypothetical protein